MENTALFIINFHNSILGGSEYHLERANEVVPIVGSVILRARKFVEDRKKRGLRHGLAIFFIQQEDEHARGPFVEGTQHWQLSFPLKPYEGLLVKSTSCAFHCHPHLADAMRDQHITRVVGMGFRSDVDVFDTLRGAICANFKTTLLWNAHTASDPFGGAPLAVERRTEIRLQHLGTQIMRSTDFMRELDMEDERINLHSTPELLSLNSANPVPTQMATPQMTSVTAPQPQRGVMSQKTLAQQVATLEAHCMSPQQTTQKRKRDELDTADSQDVGESNEKRARVDCRSHGR